MQLTRSHAGRGVRPLAVSKRSAPAVVVAPMGSIATNTGHQAAVSAASPPVDPMPRPLLRATLRCAATAETSSSSTSSTSSSTTPGTQTAPSAAPAAPATTAAGTGTAAVEGRRGAAVIQPPYFVLITGSTKGIGRALAEEHLVQGDTVVITSRSAERVAATVAELGAKYGTDRVKGRACNVADAGEVRALADWAKAQLGRIDLWLNNAGSNAYSYKSLLESEDSDLANIVETNVLGVIFCCKEAIRVMRDQPAGHIFNMDGAGASGQPTPRFAVYGATKRSLQQLGASLNAELAAAKITNLCVHNLSPGMVTTDLLMSGADTPTAKFFINCLAEEPRDVAAFLVPRIRAVPRTAANPLTGSFSPTYHKFLTQPRAVRQILGRLLLGRRKDRFVKE